MKIINKSALGFVLMIVALSSLFTKTLFAWSTGPGSTGQAHRATMALARQMVVMIPFPSSIQVMPGFPLQGLPLSPPGETIKLKVSFNSSSGKIARFWKMTATDTNDNQIGKFKAIRKTTQVIPPNDYRGLKKKTRVLILNIRAVVIKRKAGRSSGLPSQRYGDSDILCRWKRRKR